MVLNDHRPLKSIFNKSIVDSPPRIQRFLFKLQKYDFEFEYAPGKTMLVADALSRAQLPDSNQEVQEDEIVYQIHHVMDKLPISEN